METIVPCAVVVGVGYLAVVALRGGHTEEHKATQDPAALPRPKFAFVDPATMTAFPGELTDRPSTHAIGPLNDPRVFYHLPGGTKVSHSAKVTPAGNNPGWRQRSIYAGTPAGSYERTPVWGIGEKQCDCPSSTQPPKK